MAATVAGTPGGPTAFSLPGAIWLDEGPPLRELTLRPLGPEDELFALDSAATLGPTERANALLERCLVGSAAGPGLMTRLSMGDREAALLCLRKLSVGDRLEAIVTCPASGCGALMELDLSVDHLLLGSAEEPLREYLAQVGVDGRTALVTFRLPTTADLAAASDASREDPDQGASDLLSRCVIRIVRAGRDVAPDSLDEAARDAISDAMADVDPQAVIELELTCPACGLGFTVPFDAGAYLVQEVDARAASLLEAIHALALHYHWSEQEILRLPPGRRERYLELIARGDGSDPAGRPDAT
jgi:hypothetical protein